MAKNVKNAPTQAEANVGEIFSKSEKFIETYKNLIITVVAAIVIIVVAILGVRQYYFIPQEKEAQAAIFQGENYFANQQWGVALNGDSVSYTGFLDIIDDYGITKTAKLAKVYAGICYYHLNQPEEALKFLKGFSANDKVISPLILGLIGDCYVDLGEAQKGIDFFKKAATKLNSEILSPIYLKKAGIAYESIFDYKNAVEVYNTLKNKYPDSQEAVGVEKYIERAAGQIK
jgi:tetratricopeptide (TPR) repeat protein